MSSIDPPSSMPQPGHLRMENTRQNLPHSFMLKRPQQSRSREMVHAILDATLFVIEEEGADNFTTNRVADVAGISVGSLYQYFENKEMLVAGTIERGIMDSAAIVGDALSKNPHAPPIEVLHAAAHAVAEGLKPYRKLLTHAFSMTPLASTTGVIPLLESRITTVIRAWLASRLNQKDYPLTDALRITARTGVLAMIHWLTDLQDSIDQDVFARTLSAMLAAGLAEAMGEMG